MLSQAFKTLFSFIFLLSVVVQPLALSLPTRDSLQKHRPPFLPSQDAFYKPDNLSWQSSLPGTILKSRSVELGPEIIDVTHVDSAYQLLYRTSDAQGCPSYAVTTVIIPNNTSDNKLLSFQIPYDSPDNNCSPSYWVQKDVPPNPYGLFGRFRGLLETFLSEGIPINVPDYEGINAAFTVGTQSGYAVLDSLRAIQMSRLDCLASSSLRITMLGYSGGALATEWASELHATYAPEVTISGAAIGGLPTNITKTFFAITGTSNAGLISAAFNGIANTYSCFASYLDQHLLPEYAERFYSTKSQCSRGSRGMNEVLPIWSNDMASYFDNGDRIMYDFATLLNSIGTMGFHGAPIAPLFVWQGTKDEIMVPIEDTDALVKKYCAQGTKITYVRVENGRHGDALIAGMPGAEVFLRAMFEGGALDECTNTTIPTGGKIN